MHHAGPAPDEIGLLTGPDGWVSLRQDVRAGGGYAYGAVGADIHVFGDGTPVYLLFAHRPTTAHDTEWLRPSQPDAGRARRGR